MPCFDLVSVSLVILIARIQLTGIQSDVFYC